MTSAKQLAMLSEEEYLAFEATAETRHEYLGGYLHAMAGGRVRHHRIASNALAALVTALRGKPCEAFNSDTKVRIKTAGATRFYYPDAMVVCDSNEDDSVFQDRPVVLVEVLSDSTRRTDWIEKRDAYLTIPTLAAYLLVETTEPSVTVYRRRAEGRDVEAFDAELFPGRDAVIPLAEIETELPLAEIYERVVFDAT